MANSDSQTIQAGVETVGGPPAHRCANYRSAIWNRRDFALAGTRTYPGPKPTTDYKHGPPPSDIVCHSGGWLVQRCFRLEFAGNVLWSSQRWTAARTAKRHSPQSRLSRLAWEARNQSR